MLSLLLLLPCAVAPDSSAADIRAAVRALGDDSFLARERAQRCLAAMHRLRDVTPHLERGTRSKDPEVRLRCRRLLYACRPWYTPFRGSIVGSWTVRLDGGEEFDITRVLTFTGRGDLHYRRPSGAIARQGTWEMRGKKTLHVTEGNQDTAWHVWSVDLTTGRGSMVMIVGGKRTVIRFRCHMTGLNPTAKENRDR